MGVKYSTLQTASGFTSPSFNVDDTGALLLTSINVQEIKLGGDVIFTTAGAGTTGLVPSIVDSNLQTLGTLSELSVDGAVTISTGPVVIFSTTTGELENIAIGLEQPASAAFTSLSASGDVIFSSTVSASSAINVSGVLGVTGDANLSGTVTIYPTTLVGSMDNVNIGSNTPGTGVFDSIQLTQEAEATNQVPTKGYVDKRATALSIALGT